MTKQAVIDLFEEKYQVVAEALGKKCDGLGCPKRESVFGENLSTWANTGKKAASAETSFRVGWETTR